MKYSISKSWGTLLVILALTFSVFGVASAQAGSSWLPVGTAGFSAGTPYCNSLKIDSRGVPYLAYMDGANSNKATVLKYNGSSWGTVGVAGFSAGAISSCTISLAITSSGVPYVAFSDGGNSDKLTVMKYDDSGWVAVGSAGFTAGAAYAPSLAIDASGTPYVAFQDRSTPLYSATVAKYNGASWVTVGTAGFTNITTTNISLVMDSSGTPYLAYASNSSKLTVLKYNGSSWGTVGVAGFSAGSVTSLSLAFDAGNTLYAAYGDGGNSNKATVMKYNGSSWVSVGMAGFSAGMSQTVSLAMSPNGRPYVAYRDLGNSGKATVMEYNGSSWAPVGIVGFSAGQVSYTSLAIDSSGAPYLAYRDWANSDKLTVMKYGGHVVTFDANGGSGSMSPQAAIAATALTANAFTRTGYTFSGWNTAANGSGTVYADGATYDFSADITLYAQWTALPNHTVIFHANGGSGSMAPQTANLATVLSSNVFTRPGYSFSGWNTAANGSGTAYADGAAYDFSADITLYAQWTSLPIHTVIFIANGGFGSMPAQTANLATVLSSNVFTRPGYSFSGWNTAANGSGTAYADGAAFSFSEDLTLYAQWLILVNHTVAFQANGGSGSMLPQIANTPTALTANTFTRIGHTFSGWNTAADGSGAAYADSATYDFSTDLTLHAQWNLSAATFKDVPMDHWAWQFIERLYQAGVTGGCGSNPLTYCPGNFVTRAQMAVFLLKGIHGPGFIPPAVDTHTDFTDVEFSHWAATWIKQLAAESITGGCGRGIYCPENGVTRAQMAVFLLKSTHGASYSPPPATGTFGDVPTDHWAAAWIEQLAVEGITSGCGPGLYCPEDLVTRAQMAVFLVRTFSLP